MTSSKRREFCPIIYGKRACCRIFGSTTTNEIAYHSLPCTLPFQSVTKMLHDYIHNFSWSIYINIRRHSKLSFFSFNYDDSFWQKKKFCKHIKLYFSLSALYFVKAVNNFFNMAAAVVVVRSQRDLSL